jgi:hypothetical protein
MALVWFKVLVICKCLPIDVIQFYYEDPWLIVVWLKLWRPIVCINENVFLEFWVGSNPSLKNRLLRWGLPSLINISSDHLTQIQCGTLNTPPYAQHYWAWCMDINGGWPNSRNLIAADPTNRGGDSDTILEFWVGPNSSLQSRFCKVELSPTQISKSIHGWVVAQQDKDTIKNTIR